MMITYLKALSGNRPEAREKMVNNPGWWIGEGYDRAGVTSVAVELANMFEKATGFNPVKAPFKAFDSGDAISQKNQNRNFLGAVLGPSAGMIEDTKDVARGVSDFVNKDGRRFDWDNVTKGQKNAGERMLPFNSYAGLRQMLRYVANPPD
jgi:hypothetical protein